jgi:prevent-host-death family protein
MPGPLGGLAARGSKPLAHGAKLGAMKSVSITQAKRGLSELMATEQTVEITNRGTPVGALHSYAQAKFDPQRAQDAARRIRALSAKCKPSPRHGATKAVRDLRDNGE